MKTIFAIIFITIAFLSIGLVGAHEEDNVENDGHHMDEGMMGNNFWGSGMMGFWGMGLYGWTFMILVLVALILFIVWLIKQIQGAPIKR